MSSNLITNCRQLLVILRLAVNLSIVLQHLYGRLEGKWMYFTVDYGYESIEDVHAARLVCYRTHSLRHTDTQIVTECP